MSGHFEVFIDAYSHFRFRLIGPRGNTLLESGPYEDKQAVAVAIFDVRECAGTGLVEDHSTKPLPRSPSVSGPAPRPASAVSTGGRTALKRVSMAGTMHPDAMTHRT
ncbi:YegP family protein [Paenarthrobacter sp. JL.01a]|uniref:YegP family protein n=1 Tax=Paenarthrobacter sp. JL.01a TaxID=2979324 RepID=UPI0021C6A36C|nr:YegP family protein [Paenarthrobacter sp. JL.01a]UXM93511.1 YegP family protein [Paenarthrobacter sp. JL.01a]